MALANRLSTFLKSALCKNVELKVLLYILNHYASVNSYLLRHT